MDKTVTLIVGYRTRAVDNVEALAAAFAPAEAAWQAVAEQDGAAKPEGFAALAAKIPLFATLDEISLLDPFADNVGGGKGKYRSWRHDPSGEKPPPAVRCREYLRGAYPEAWHADGRTVLRFLSLDADLFVRVLAFDCARPGVDKPMPFATWNEDLPQHISLLKRLVPPELPPHLATEYFKQWRPADSHTTKHWVAMLEAWPEYNQNPKRDAIIAMELAGQLGWI